MSGGITFIRSWVLADGSSGTVGSSTAILPWWSFTKTVLSIGALRLVEQGRLNLDAPQHGKPYSLRQLLQHTAGVPNYGGLAAYHKAVANGEDAWSREKLLAMLGPNLDFPPGTNWAYSNIAYMIVGDMIEQASEEPLEKALQRLVVEPLGLSSVRLATQRNDFRDIEWPGLRGYDPRWVYHGCLTGTAQDAARILHALFEGRLLKPETLQRMCGSYALGGAIQGRPWTTSGYGLGLMQGRMADAGEALGHSGAGPFSTNAVYHFRDLAIPVTVAVFCDDPFEGHAENAARSVAIDLQHS